MKSVKAVGAVVLVQAVLLTAQSTKDLTTARQLFNSRQFMKAAGIYSALAAISPELAEAHVGLVRTRLGQNNECALVSPAAPNSIRIRKVNAPPASFDIHSPVLRFNASLGKADAGTFQLASGREILLSPAYAKKTGITRVPNSSNSSSKNYVGIADSLRIGSLEFKNCVVRVSESVARGGGIRLPDGILGLGLFADFLMTLDFGKDEIRLEPLGSPRPGEIAPWIDRDATVDRKDFIPMLQLGQELAISIRVNSSEPLLFGLSPNGSPSAVAPEVAKEVLRLPTVVLGGTGPCSVNCVSFELGTQRANAALLPISLARPSFDMGIQLDGMLGTNVLVQFVVTIDARNGFIKFEKFR
jgi:hypothetical protein